MKSKRIVILRATIEKPICSGRNCAGSPVRVSMSRQRRVTGDSGRVNDMPARADACRQRSVGIRL